MVNEGVLENYPGFSVQKDSTCRLGSAMSEDNRGAIEDKLFVGKLLEETYPQYHTEIEMLILSVSNYTHREIANVLNISRLGVTKRIAKAREVLSEKYFEMLGD